MVSGRDMTSVRVVMWAVLALVVMSQSVSGRYLPTRSQDDRIDRLRELLKDLLENQSENFRGISSTGGEGNALDGAGAYAGIGASGPHSVMFKRNAPLRNSMSAFNPGKLPLLK